MLKTLLLALAAGCALPPVFAAGDAPVTGAGSTAAAPIYQSWAREYQKSQRVPLSYEAIGSSAGLKKIKQGEVGFGASDVAPPEAELARDGLTLFPVAITGVAPVVNLPKVGDGQLKLSGELLARIFMGEVTQWNAPDIAQLNPGLALPRLPIKVVVRSDGSGTTHNFADYLAKVSADWQKKMGVKTTLAWPDGVIPAKGSDGVVKAVKDTEGAIGYVDFGYVVSNKLATAQLRNLDGHFVSASNLGFKSALANSDWVSKAAFTSPLTQRPGQGSWPITMGTFVVLPRTTSKPELTLPALKFFVWAFFNGDTLVQDNHFVRIPDQVQAKAFKVIFSIKDSAGKFIGVQLLNADGKPAP